MSKLDFLDFVKSKNSMISIALEEAIRVTYDGFIDVLIVEFPKSNIHSLILSDRKYNKQLLDLANDHYGFVRKVEIVLRSNSIEDTNE